MELIIPSYYDAFRQGKMDARTDRINAMQDDLASQQKQMAQDQKRMVDGYKYLQTIESASEAEKPRLYKLAYPKLAQMFPEYNLPTDWSPQVAQDLPVIKKWLLSQVPAQYEKVGDTLYEIRGGEIRPVGQGNKGVKIRTQNFATPEGAQYQEYKPEQVDVFGNTHIGKEVFVQGASESVPLSAYERWLQGNVSPEQYAEYQKSRVNIPVDNMAPANNRRVPNYTPSGVAGRTNQGYPIDGNEPPLSPTPMPSSVPAPTQPAPAQPNPKDYLNPDGSLKKRQPAYLPPEVDYSMDGEDVTMTGGQMPNRFAQLQPFGSAPMNRLGGSQGIEGIDYAYTGARMVRPPTREPQPQKLTKEDLMIRAGRGDQEAIRMLQRMAEVEKTIKPSKIPESTMKNYQQAMADMEGIRGTLTDMRRHRAMLQKGDINMNILSRAGNAPLTLMDMQSDTYNNTSVFLTSIQDQVNALLTQNKGVQTDSDAVRALQSITHWSAKVSNSAMEKALTNAINKLNRTYATQLRTISDYRKQYKGLGE